MNNRGASENIEVPQTAVWNRIMGKFWSTVASCLIVSRHINYLSLLQLLI